MMTGLRLVQNLMLEIGPRLELAEVTEFTDEANWLLVVDGETVISVDYDSENEQLILTAEVATPPERSAAKVYEQLLQFNYQWPETGGLRFALDGPGGTVVQMFSLPLGSTTDLQKLATVVGNFVQQLGLWRNLILEGMNAATGAVEEVEDLVPFAAGMIQA